MLKKCEYCGEEFNVKKSRYERTHFCSMECRKASRGAVIMCCDTCGKEIVVPKNKQKRLASGEQKNIFCSRECCDAYSMLSMDELKEEFFRRGYSLVSENYDNAHSRLKYICNKHVDMGINEISYYNFMTGYGCKYCGYESTAEKQRKSFDDVKKAFDDRGMILLNQNYVNSVQKLSFICKSHPEKGIQYKSYGNVVGSNVYGCPYCNKSKGEKTLETFFIENNIEFCPQKKFDNLLGIKGHHLSYDFYLPDYNLLVEYQGEFHDGTTSLQKPEDFIIQREHDRRKREFAIQNGIELLEIWYYENTLEKIKEYLNM